MAPPTSTPIQAEGRPVDAATLAAITRTAREWIACRNAGDPLRQLALFSDEGLARFIASYGPPPSTQGITLDATPSATPRPPEARIAFIMVRDARVQSDGRIQAIIVENRPGAPLLENSSQVVFVRREGRWLIDELVFQDAAPDSDHPASG